NKFSIIFILGFLSGFPLPLFGNLLQAWFASSGASVLMMSSLGILNAFALCRFIWGPLLDRFYFAKIGRRKTWILITQSMIFCSLCLMALLSPSHHPHLLMMTAAVLAWMASLADVAIDAHRIEFIDPTHYGFAAVIAVYAYRLALLCSGGMAFFIAHLYGFELSYALMALVVLIAMSFFLFSKEPKVNLTPDAVGFKKAYQDIFQKTWFVNFAGLIFSLKMGEVFVANSSPMIIPFLIDGIGLDLKQIAYINNVFGLFAQLTGGAVAAFLLNRYAAFKLLQVLGAMEILSNLLFLCLSLHQQLKPLLWLSIMIENLASGLCSTVLLTCIMRVVNPQFTATQFSFWMMFVIIPRVLAGPIGGLIHHHFNNWSSVFMLSTTIASTYLYFWYKLKKEASFLLATS
ncbi:MAG: MFS transporter, partial [Gammaproteobacteria bacterium]|nr:MFS transporter [Gammaproteobacteria bacterium]